MIVGGFISGAEFVVVKIGKAAGVPNKRMTQRCLLIIVI